MLLRGFGWPFCGAPEARSDPAAFHLHPRYRAAIPLDAVLAKIQPGTDEFASEKEHDRIAAVLAEWSAGLRASPANVDAIARSLAPDFLSVSLQPVASRVIRPGPALEVRRVTFAQDTNVGRDDFLRAWRTEMAGYAKVLTADFQITQLDARPGWAKTRVRYELVG